MDGLLWSILPTLDFLKINTNSDDTVALNKAQLQGLNIKKRDFINMKGRPLSLAKKKKYQIYYSANRETDNIAKE